MANETKQNPSKPEKTRKDSTADYPMMDLRQVCELVEEIWEKGIQSESMPAVAKSTGYSSPTSTGFYRRMVAARLFKMAESQSAKLTGLALDYLKPDSSDAKARALREAVRSVPSYQPLFEKYTGSRLNPDIIKNGIARATNLTDDCALICAKVFIESLRFAGELDGDNSLLGLAKPAQEVTPNTTENNNDKSLSTAKSAPQPNEGGLETYYLTLDASKGRRVVIQAPPSVTSAELKRVQDWLSFQLFVDHKEASSQ